MPKTAIAAGLACGALAATVLGAPIDEAAIRANVAAYESAWNKRDAAGVTQTYAPDADVIVMDGPRTAGQAAIRRRLDGDFSTLPSTTRITLTLTNIRAVTPDTAVVDTIARFNEGTVRENRGTSLFVRRDGKWLVAALRVYPAQGALGR